MKVIILFLFLFYFSTFTSAKKNLAYFELSRCAFSSRILETMSLNDTFLLVSTQDSQFFIYDLSDPESSPVQMNKFKTSIPFNDFKVSSDDFLIGIGNNLVNKTQTLEIYQIRDLNDVSHVSTYELSPEGTNETRSLICFSKKCETISFVDVQQGIRLINLTSKESPNEIPQPAVLQIYKTYQTLVIENELIATFDPIFIVALNITNLTNIQIASFKIIMSITGITSYDGIIVFMTCGNDWTGVLYQWNVQDYNSTKNQGFYKWFASSLDPNFVSNPMNNYVCATSNPSTIKIYDDFLLITTPRFQLNTFPNWDYYSFENYLTTDALLWKTKFNYYISFVYKSDQYFQTSIQFNLSTVSIPYSIVSSTAVSAMEAGPQSMMVTGDTIKYLIVSFSKSRCFYYLIGNPKAPTIVGYFSEILNDVNKMWRDAKKRYFMIFGNYIEFVFPDLNSKGYVMLIYDYNLSQTTVLAYLTILNSGYAGGFTVNPVQFDDLLYLFPITWSVATKLKEHMLVVNITDLNNLVLEETNVESGTGQFISAAGGCTKSNERYIFIKRSTEPKIIFYKVSNSSYNVLEEIGFIFVFSNIGYIVTSKDCNYLHAGGEVFYTVEITDFSNPKILSTLNIMSITGLNIINDKIYVTTQKIIYIFDLARGFPVLLNSVAHPVRDEEAKYNIYDMDILETDNSNYIYKGSRTQDSKGGAEFTVYEEKKLYYIYLKQNKNLIVGTPVNYRYFCLNIENLVETKGVISSVHLTNTSANFPTLTSIPTWIEFDFNTQVVALTVPKNYEYENLSLSFEIKYPYYENPEIYHQVITFSYAKSSLSYQLDPHIIITSPTNSNIQIRIQHNPDILFIFLNFAGVFTSYSEETGVLVASGLLDAINDMFKKLRITHIEQKKNYAQSINLTITDNLNNDISGVIINYNESTFRRNQPPKCSLENIQELIDTQISYLVPFQKFSLDLTPTIFTDPEGDPLNFKIFPVNGDSLPLWLSFDSTSLRFSGIPLDINEMGLLNISLQISDGYDYITKDLYLNISDAPPNVSIQTATQLTNNKISVGEEFIFNLNTATFQDADGPYSLEYWIYFRDMNNDQKQWTSASNYWLKFDYSTFSFSGTPNFQDSFVYGNNVTITIFAYDGVKNCSDSFAIRVFPSLKNILIDENSIPIVEYLADRQLTAEIVATSGKILVLNEFFSNYSSRVSYSINSEMNQIKIESTYNIINKAFNYLVYRNISENINRTLQESSENSDNISYRIFDSLDQSISGGFLVNKIMNSNTLPKINEYFIENDYLAEIGASFRVIISKKLIDFVEVPNMQLNYSFILNDSYGIKQNWIYMQENEENLEFFTGGSVDSAFIGEYKGLLVITDEFKNEYKHVFIIEVDYSTLDKMKNYLQLISTIVGPIISFLAITKFFYIVYNLIWRKKIEKKDIYLKINTPFKIKVPLIEEEFKVASKLFKIIHATAMEENKKYCQYFLNAEIMKKPEPLVTQNKFTEYVKQFFKEFYHKKDNVIILTEGLLIKHLVEKTPHASYFLKEFQLETIRTQTSDVDEWYNQFFFDEKLKNEQELKEILLDSNAAIEKLKISDYVLQIGTYQSVEKNIYILGHYYDFIFEKTLARLKKIKFSQEQKLLLKYLILRAIIEIKRGIPFNYSNKIFTLNNILSVFGLRILPYIFGDAILLPDCSVKYIKTFEERSKNDEIAEKQGISYRLKRLGLKLFPYRPYYSINDKSFPNWLNVDMKKGYLIFHGTPYKEEIQKKYMIRICTATKFNIMQFRINISDFDQMHAKAMSLTRRMSRDPKIKSTFKGTSAMISEENRNILSPEIQMSPMKLLKSEEIIDADGLDERVEVKVIKK